jgi:pimeloyl-ACP methyl ester carboxylesterase
MTEERGEPVRHGAVMLVLAGLLLPAAGSVRASEAVPEMPVTVYQGANDALAEERKHQAIGVVLSGTVYTDAAGRAELGAFFKQWHVQPDGSHLLEKWQKMSQWLPRPLLVQRFVIDLFKSGETSEQGHFAVADYRMEDRLPLVSCPALLIFNKHDPFASPERAAPLRAAFKPATEVTLDAGVFVANETPEAFARAVLDYVH